MGSVLTTIEGVVENGLVKLPPDARLPDQTKVYVVAPGISQVPTARMASHRLARPEQAIDFTMHVLDAADAAL